MLSFGVRKLYRVYLWLSGIKLRLLVPPILSPTILSRSINSKRREWSAMVVCVCVAAAVKSPGKLDSSFMDGEEGNFSLQHLSHLNPRLCNYSENGIG